jgi:hypothetical protein
MQYNSDLKAQVAIVGHAVFAGDHITHFVRPGINELAASFSSWISGAGLFTRRAPDGKRQVVAITLFRQAPNSDQQRVAMLLQADFAQDPTTEALGGQPGITLSTVQFDSHAVPIPLVPRIAENIYAQLFHQYHDGSNS